MKLPYMHYGSSYQLETQNVFGGIDRSADAGDGVIREDANVISLPNGALKTRPPLHTIETLTSSSDLWADDVPFWVDGTTLYVDGVSKGTVSEGRKQFARINRQVAIWPDRKIYNLDTGTLEDAWYDLIKYAPQFNNGKIYGVPAAANTIQFNERIGTIKPGDAVTISGATIHPENNKSAIVREVSYSESGRTTCVAFDEYTWTLDDYYVYPLQDAEFAAGDIIEFYVPRFQQSFYITVSDLYSGYRVNSGKLKIEPIILPGAPRVWHIPDVGAERVWGYALPGTPETAYYHLELTTVPEQTYRESGYIHITKNIPDLDCLISANNRLWGAKGDTIYASKLGDPTIWESFDGLTTDSWQAEVASSGDFTGAVVYQGYPMFFKENIVYKVYGDRPENFSLQEMFHSGVAANCGRSLCIVNEVLYWVSPQGVMAYSGGIPALISRPLGDEMVWSNACAGGEGDLLYLNVGGAYYTYNTVLGVWHRNVYSTDPYEYGKAFAYWDGSLKLLTGSGDIVAMTDSRQGTEEDTVEWSVDFTDTTAVTPLKKGLLRLLIRSNVSNGAEMEVYLRYDSDQIPDTPATELTGTISNDRKPVYETPLIVRRCDSYGLTLKGSGDVTLLSVSQERYVGSEKAAKNYR